MVFLKRKKNITVKHEEQRVAVLIDVQNMYHSAKNLHKSKVNFEEVLKTAISDRKLIRAIAYGIETEGKEERGFFEALRNMGIEVKMKDLQIFPGGFKKGDWDVGIAVDAIKFSEYLDAVVLITGDGDFIPLVEYIKNAKPTRVEIVAFGRSCSGQLKQIADDFIDLEQNTKKYLIK
ncbi:MAG: NYN domain-containing protein [Candidatus Pacebacteria bacterium]|nr:NYN domain-containing protein [Candidatus Paceibacterota bacterium]